MILDIFAQHATSREGKAQVELAQLEYMLPLTAWLGWFAVPSGRRSRGRRGCGHRIARPGRDQNRNGPSCNSHAYRQTAPSDS